MRILAAILFVFGTIAYAELPDIVQEPSSREALEYLDAKTSKAVSVVKTFESATATTTFSGYIDIGRDTNSAGCSGCTSVTATCDAGLYIVYGGCEADTGTPYLKVNRASSSTVWTCSAAGATNLTAYVTCARVK